MLNENPILKARSSLGLSQTELARELGVNQSTVWRWENEKLPLNPLVRRAVEQLLSEKERAV